MVMVKTLRVTRNAYDHKQFRLDCSNCGHIGQFVGMDETKRLCDNHVCRPPKGC